MRPLSLWAFLVVPQGQAFASALLHLFRGQSIQPIATDYAHPQNAYKALEDLEKLGSRTPDAAGHVRGGG